MKTHRELYPEQYAHPLVGKRVKTPANTEGVVERVVDTRWGKLAILENTHGRAYPVERCSVLD